MKHTRAPDAAPIMQTYDAGLRGHCSGFAVRAYGKVVPNGAACIAPRPVQLAEQNTQKHASVNQPSSHTRPRMTHRT